MKQDRSMQVCMSEGKYLIYKNNGTLKILLPIIAKLLAIDISMRSRQVEHD